MQDNQQVVFLTDGGEDIRDVPRYLNPQAEHYIDWFHITMRLLEDLRDDFDTAYRPEVGDKQCAFSRQLAEFCVYIGRNSEEIPNYGERYRCGEPISTATAEATVNRVISRRMVKKQQMRWSPRGAHLLLQVRTRVLNDDLAADFARWYPGLGDSARQTDVANDAA
jgi:hypothetical protein